MNFRTTNNPDKPKTQSVTGALRDTQADKPRFDLIGIPMLKRLAALLQRGAKQYGERNWELGQEVSRTYGSLFRHLIAWAEGDRVEDHLAAIVFNAMSIINVEEGVLAGKLPDSLLDMPFYADLDQFHTPAPLTPLEMIVYQHMSTVQHGEVWAEWTQGEYLRKATLPTLNPVDFSTVMRGLIDKGYVATYIHEERVYPDYALCQAVQDEENLDPDDYEDYGHYGEDEYEADEVEVLVDAHAEGMTRLELAGTWIDAQTGQPPSMKVK